MINWSFVLQRINEELSLPFQVLELKDPEIKDYLLRNAVKKYSWYFPNKNTITIDAADPNVKVPNKSGTEFYINDPEKRTIISVSGFYPSFGTRLLLGHPFIGAFTYESVPEYALGVERANNAELFSIYNYTTQFLPPNRLRVSPIYQGRATVEYERSIDPELCDINPELEDEFINLCLGMIMMRIGRLRKRYNNIETPFGAIELNGDDLFNEGKELYDATIQRFDERSLTNVVFDRG